MIVMISLDSFEWVVWQKCGRTDNFYPNSLFFMRKYLSGQKFAIFCEEILICIRV